jgi:Domain of unknown function (DUF4342)
MSSFDHMFEQFKVAGKEVGDTLSQVFHEGNVRRVVIKNEQGHTLMEVPVTVATIGVIAAPVLAAAGAIAAMVGVCTIEVERHEPPADSTKADPTKKD